MKRAPIPDGSIITDDMSGLLYLVDGDCIIALSCERSGDEYHYDRYRLRRDKQWRVIGHATLPEGTIVPSEWPQYTTFVSKTWIRWDRKLQNGDST